MVWAIKAQMGASGAFGHWLMILARHRAPASAMAPFGYTQLLWIIFNGWLVFGDRPPGAKLIGAGIVIGCGGFLPGASAMASADGAALVTASRSPI